MENLHDLSYSQKQFTLRLIRLQTTSVVLKCFEKIVQHNLLDLTKGMQDPFQFEYKPNRSIDDTILTLLHNTFLHANNPKSYVRILFADFSSAFNTIKPYHLAKKLVRLNICPKLVIWIINFLSHRKQLVRFKGVLSGERSISTGVPQGCVLSPVLFTLYTNDCTGTENTIFIKYSDDTTIVDLSNSIPHYIEEVETFTTWCKDNVLDLNVTETKELLIVFRKQPPAVSPITIDGAIVERVEKYKYLGIGGGIATVYKSTLGSNITFKTNFDFTHTSFEVVQASITLQHNTLHFFCLYRPPPNRRNNLTDSMFTEQLPDLLDYVNSLPGFVCLVGDMNIHFDNPLQSLTKQTLSTLSLYDLVQVINKPTHRCGHIIDWVIVRPDDDIHRKSTVTDSLESDHYCTKSYFNISVEKPSTLYRTVRNIANIDRPSFIAELSSVSEFSSVENANQFCDFLRTVLDKHAPPSLRKVITHSSSPWFESIRDELFIAKRERRQAERKWMNTKLIIFKDLYRQAKHKVSKLVHTAKCKFYTERIALASSSKELHQIVNTLSNRHPPKILPTIYPSADLPSIFIKHFTNKVEKLRANIASEHVTSTLVTGTTAATFSSFEKVSQLTVKECILSSAPKSCELDPIPSKLLIECLDSILPSLTDLFNSSLASGIFPQCFKSALVTPILKKRCLDHNDLNNYRPVSNLCFIAKILEKLVLSQVSSYLNSHNLYNTCQSAYRPGHSTETALLKVVNDLFLSLNKGNISVLALLDFSSAFDTIDHTILVHRLHTDFGFTDTVLQWFSSYLTDRTHYVSLCNHCSDFAPVHSGVPQGSVLGPILFTMYIKPLSAIIDSHSIIHHSFADDLQLQMSAPPDRISELLHSMQSCISDVKAWATVNMLRLNDSKTELMLVTSKRSKHLHNLPTSITIGNAQIPFKQSVKNLGFTLDCHLTMNAHVSNIARTCYFELRRLAYIRRFLTSTATATLVSAFVLSRIDYCNSLLFGSTLDVTSHLQRIQNYAARVILRLPMSSRITIHLKSLHWLPVKVRSTYKIACLCYHCHSSTAPSYVTDMLHKKTLHTRNTRSSSYTMPLLNRPAHSKATLGDRSFSFASSSVWNSIPNDVKCAPSLSSFKSRLKTYLFRSVYKD